MRVLVVALCFALNMLDGTDVLIMSYVAPVLSDEWAVSPERLGVRRRQPCRHGCRLSVRCPAGRRLRPRALILGALLAVAVAMILSGLSRDVAQLTIARFFVGIGVGTIGVSMTAMAAEYAPARHQSFAVGFVQAGWPLGSILTALTAANLLPRQGWHSLLSGIGVLGTCLLILIWLLLPESLSFLEARRPVRALERINAIRARLSLPALRELPPSNQPLRGFRIAALFDSGRARSSLLLWTSVTLAYFVLYFVISWIPKLVSQAGLPVSDAIYAGAAYNLGAFIGTAAVGWIAVRLRIQRVVASFLGLAAVSMLVFGGFTLSVRLTLLAALCVGVTVQGGFNGFWAVAARLYPAEMRSTGIGWALGVGRIGAVLGPIVGGVLVGAHVSMAAIFALYAVPLVAAACLTLQLALP